MDYNTKTNEIEVRINNVIRSLEKQGEINTNNIEDGSHSFGQVYFNRMILFAMFTTNYPKAWRSKLHEDGTMFDNYFITGVELPNGKNLTYHYHESQWSYFDHVETLPVAPSQDNDGKDEDLIEFLASLTKK